MGGTISVVGVMKSGTVKYVIVTPAKNEEKYIEYTLNSVISQTIKPVQWIILNDNSLDNTAEIVKKYSKPHRWITLINVKKFNFDEYSARVIYLFNLGVTHINKEYDYIVKLDADVSFENDFFERILTSFESNPKLGIASGCLIFDGVKENMKFADNTRGATKFYRKKCLDEIGGLFLSRGWDVMDDVAARSKGWDIKTLDYTFSHHKEEGIQSGLIKKHYNTGLFNGRVPYHPLYFFLKVMKVVFLRPIFIGSCFQLVGYLNARFISKQRPFPKEVSDYLRKEQITRIKNSYLLKWL